MFDFAIYVPPCFSVDQDHHHAAALAAFGPWPVVVATCATTSDSRDSLFCFLFVELSRAVVACRDNQ